MVAVERKSPHRFAGLVAWVFVAGCATLVGCESGTLSGTQQSCASNFGLLDRKEVECTGSVNTARGSPSLSVIEIGEDLDGAFRLEATIRVGRGTAKAHVTDVDGERVGGEVSPGEPLRIVAVVYPEEEAGTEEEEGVGVQLEIAEGEEVRDLTYDATLVAQD